MTSRHALDYFSARHTRRNIKIGFLRTSEEEIYVTLSVSQRTCKNIPRTMMFSSLLWLQGMDFWLLLLEFVIVNFSVEYIFQINVVTYQFMF